MIMREKLIDIVIQTPCVEVSSRTAAGHIVDNLIANGVMIRPQTNADRIRSMSDEELEQFINHFDICDSRTNEECKMSYCACCEVCVMDWLKQPAEG